MTGSALMREDPAGSYALPTGPATRGPFGRWRTPHAHPARNCRKRGFATCRYVRFAAGYGGWIDLKPDW